MTIRALADMLRPKKSVLLAFMLLGVCFFAMAFVSIAQAEPKLVSTSPQANTYLDYNNNAVEVRITFSEKLKPEGSTFTVSKEDGADKGVPATVQVDPNNPNQLFAPLGTRSALGSNRYTVTYTAVSAADNSVSSGSFQFFILPPNIAVSDPSYLFSTPSSAFTGDWKGYTYPPLATIFFFMLLAGAIVGNFFYFYGRYAFFSKNRLTYTLVGRASKNLAIVTSLGLVFFLCRIAGLQPLNARVFLYLIAVYFIYLLVRGVIYMSRTYPKAKAAWREIQEKSRPKREKAPAPVIPAATSVSADAGDTNDAGKREEVRAAIETPRGQSSRGEKRRAKKRDRH